MTNTATATTGFCGVILATLLVLNLPVDFGVNAASKANNFARNLVPDTCLATTDTLAECQLGRGFGTAF